MTEYICPKCGKEVIVEPMSKEEKDRMADRMLFYPSYNRRHYVVRCGCPGEKMVCYLDDDAVFEEYEGWMKEYYLERDYSIKESERMLVESKMHKYNGRIDYAITLNTTMDPFFDKELAYIVRMTPNGVTVEPYHEKKEAGE